MPSLRSRDRRVAYEMHGTGRPVVMLHGITVSFAGNFGPSGWIPRLVAAGCQVIGIGLFGHGQSDKVRRNELAQVEATRFLSRAVSVA